MAEMEEKGPPPQAAEGGEGAPAEGGGDAAGAIKSIQDGFQTLSKMMQAAQGSLSPEDVQLFEQAVQATDAFVQSISGPAEQAPPQAPPPPGGPMAQNANPKASPAGY